MDLRRNARGHRVVTLVERQQILDEIKSGVSPVEAARRYELAIWTVKRWMMLERRTGEETVTSLSDPAGDQSVPRTEYQKLKTELDLRIAELKATRKSLAVMTVNRDILADAVEIAGKKKWI